MLVVILDPVAREGTEGTLVLLVLPVNFLVYFEFVRCGTAEGTLAALVLCRLFSYFIQQI